MAVGNPKPEANTSFQKVYPVLPLQRVQADPFPKAHLPAHKSYGRSLNLLLTHHPMSRVVPCAPTPSGYPEAPLESQALLQAKKRVIPSSAQHTGPRRQLGAAPTPWSTNSCWTAAIFLRRQRLPPVCPGAISKTHPEARMRDGPLQGSSQRLHSLGVRRDHSTRPHCTCKNTCRA